VSSACTPLVPGEAVGHALVLGEPLSFWGGVDAADGRIIDRRHPQHGECVAGRVLVMPAGRGSSSSSSVIAELVRAGAAPAAIVLREADPIIALGALVAELLYDVTMPVLLAPPDAYARIGDGDVVRIAADGRVATAVQARIMESET
jgi:uncharacterized protein